jgi:hypothetical protein
MSGGHGESKTPTVLIIIIGIFLIGAMIGIFYPKGISRVKTAVPAIDKLGYIKGQNVNPNEQRATDAYYTKANIDSAVCGIKVFSPLPSQKVSFPLEVSGYVNGCNWAPFEGQVGTLEIRDANNALSKLIILPVEQEDNYTLPAYFKVKITPEMAPGTQNGVLIFHNEDASGEKAETFQIPINF